MQRTDTLTQKAPRTRIQQKNRTAILDAALDIFSTEGFRGATLDKIAEGAGLSKPNLLYYFPSKDAIYSELLSQLLDNWLDPLRDLDGDGDPVPELLGYVRRKLEMSRVYPRESKLFAIEIVQGAPRILDEIEGPLRQLVDEKAVLIQNWVKQGKDRRGRSLSPDFFHLGNNPALFGFYCAGSGHSSNRGRAILSRCRGFLMTFYRGALTPHPD